MTSSFNVSGLLGGTAGSIDTVSLVASLMLGAAVPQNQLKDQLTALTNVQNAYQAINTNTAMMQSTAHAVTDPTAWAATAATSSTPSIVATSDSTALPGSTTFSVTQLAQAQVDTVKPASTDGIVVSTPANGITITGHGASPFTVALTSGDATSVATAINADVRAQAIGVHASVITTDQGTFLQLAATKSGVAGGFSSSGFDTTATVQHVAPAHDAQVTVGDFKSVTDDAGITTTTGTGYTISSATNTFTGLIPGVTFSVSALTANASISVTKDTQSISDKVKSLVTAANSLGDLLNTDTAQGGVLQGKLDANSLSMAIMSSVSGGTSTGGSLSTYGIDMDQYGVLSFDATKFATAFAADPTGTQTAISGSFATNLNAAADTAIAPITGSVAQDLSSGTEQATLLKGEISDWTTKLATIQATMTQKFATMETMLAKLQSQQTYLTSMFNSINGTNSNSSSS